MIYNTQNTTKPLIILDADGKELNNLKQVDTETGECIAEYIDNIPADLTGISKVMTTRYAAGSTKERIEQKKFTGAEVEDKYFVAIHEVCFTAKAPLRVTPYPSFFG